MKLVLKSLLYIFISLLVLKICDILISYYFNDNVKDLRNNLSNEKSHCINKCGLKVPQCHSKCQTAKCAENCETIEDCIAKCYHNWTPI